jgi:hypothetical protein
MKNTTIELGAILSFICFLLALGAMGYRPASVFAGFISLILCVSLLYVRFNTPEP